MSPYKYTIEYFLSDPEFKNWVLNPTPSSQLFWEKWMEGHPDQRETILSAREIILTFQFQKAEMVSSDEKEELLKNIINHDNSRRGRKNVNSNRSGFFLGMAASVVLVLSFFLYYFNQTETDELEDPITLVIKDNPRGQKTRITLPDGSKVWLNCESRIEYPNKFIGKRTISLNGEAFFEVAEDPDKPFEVFSHGILITALGTSFNVKSFESDNTQVGLVTGKISVETVNDNSNKVYVDPGKTVTYYEKNNELQVVPSTDLDFIKWTNQILVFKRANIAQIKEKLERWYDVDINVYNLNKEITFTGEFEKESLERILERMAFIEKFSFEIKEKQVNIFFE